ncbi:unnamed protein product [Cuscuta epithymum]|uniref:Protein FAR1-RELATED SEQUENCE n=1 Tax=Cuscuta epithymum TaxID=186058 RepID=A0AAV0DGF3_9ASTE|nr:unnamed protein product [Cuscuta epithymum]
MLVCQADRQNLSVPDISSLGHNACVYQTDRQNLSVTDISSLGHNACVCPTDRKNLSVLDKLVVTNELCIHYRYSLQDDEWLKVMFEERQRWVPCYLKTSFWAGMSTTQRSESINAFFDLFVHSKTSLKQFVEQYGCALKFKAEKEFQADAESFSKLVPCVSKFPMEKQMQGIYTMAKFKEFRDEVVGKLYCDIIQWDGGKIYHVKEEVKITEDFYKTVYFIVEYDSGLCECKCSCHLFEFRGIVCRHMFMVLQRNDVKILPEVYIMRRWRQDVKRPYTRVKINYDGWITTVQQQRYDKLCKTFEDLANAIADDEEKYKSVMQWMQDQLHKCAGSTTTYSVCGVMTQLPQLHTNVHGEAPGPIQDPKITKRKGAPRKNRIKGPLEKSKKNQKADPKPNKSRKNPSGMHTSDIASNQIYDFSVLTPCVNDKGLDLNLRLL